jgi:hypothetical protein
MEWPLLVKTRYPLYRRLGGPQGRSGRTLKISPLPGFEPRTVQPVASRYTDWAIRPRTGLSRSKLKIRSTQKLYFPPYSYTHWNWGVLRREHVIRAYMEVDLTLHIFITSPLLGCAVSFALGLLLSREKFHCTLYMGPTAGTTAVTHHRKNRGFFLP